jgi:hypothetical protein
MRRAASAASAAATAHSAEVAGRNAEEADAMAAAEAAAEAAADAEAEVEVEAETAEAVDALGDDLEAERDRLPPARSRENAAGAEAENEGPPRPPRPPWPARGAEVGERREVANWAVDLLPPVWWRVWL